MDAPVSYELALSLHSLLRWLVILFGVLVLLQGLVGMLTGGELGPVGRRLGLVFLICLDLQVLIGIALHVFLSPTTKAYMQDFRGSMGVPDHRFWLVEHGLAMLAALIAVHVGRVLARRASSDRAEHLPRFLTTALALLLILWATPWPFLEEGRARPWIRLPF